MLNVRQLSFSKLLPFTLPIILGLGLGFLISRGDWLFAIVLAALIPLVILFSAWPFIGVILWLLLMPLSSALPNPDLVYWGLHRLMVPFTLCMTLLPYLSKTRRMPTIKLELPEISIALLAIFVPISILIGQADIRVPIIRYADRILIPLCMYLIFRFTGLRSRDLHLLQWIIFFIAASQSAIGFISLYAPQFLPYAWRPLIRGYVAGTLLNPNAFASVLGFCICFLFQAAMDRKRGLAYFIFVITCGVSVINIFLSMERAAWLACVIVLLGLFGLYPKIMLRFSLIAAILIFILSDVFLPNYVGRVTERLNNEQTVGARYVLFDAMVQMVELKPIFGWGYETLNQNIQKYYRTVGSDSIRTGLETSHNTYLTILTELGLVGFLLYLLPAAWLLKRSIVVYRQKFNHQEFEHKSMLAILWLGALQNFLISNFMDMRFFPIAIIFWWISLALIANLINPQDKIQSSILIPS